MLQVSDSNDHKENNGSTDRPLVMTMFLYLVRPPCHSGDHAFTALERPTNERMHPHRFLKLVSILDLPLLRITACGSLRGHFFEIRNRV